MVSAAEPAQGWPSVPSPKGSPERAQRTDMTARRRLVISPRSAAELKATAARRSAKFRPTGPLPSAFAPVVAPAQQEQDQVAPGPSPTKSGKWRGKTRVASKSMLAALKPAGAQQRAQRENDDIEGIAAFVEGTPPAGVNGGADMPSRARVPVPSGSVDSSDTAGAAAEGSSAVWAPPKWPTAKQINKAMEAYTCASYDKTTNVWRCSTCASAKKQIPLAIGLPIEPRRVGARFSDHCKTEVHTRLVAASNLADTTTLAGSARLAGEKQARKLRPTRKPHVRAAAKLGAAGSPASHFKAEIELIEDSAKDMHCEMLPDGSNRNKDECKKIMLELRKHLHGKLLKKLKEARVITVSIGESTDVSTKEMLVVYLAFVDEGGEACVEYFKLVRMFGTDAGSSIYTALKSLLEEHGLWKKTVALGADGASVMTGLKNGVGAKMRADLTWILALHCINHKLALGANDAANLVTFSSEIDKLLRGIGRLVRKSAKKQLERLADLAKLHGEGKHSTKRLHMVRWLSRGQRPARHPPCIRPLLLHSRCTPKPTRVCM